MGKIYPEPLIKVNRNRFILLFVFLFCTFSFLNYLFSLLIFSIIFIIWTVSYFTECADGHYGFDCLDRCNTCHSTLYSTGYLSRCIPMSHGHIWIGTPTCKADMQAINMLLEKSKTWSNMMFSISTRPLLMLTSKTWQYWAVSEKQ